MKKSSPHPRDGHGMRGVLHGLLLLSFLAALAGCDIDPTSPPTPAFGTINIYNNTGEDIGYIRYRPAGGTHNAVLWSRDLMSDIPGAPALPYGYNVTLRVQPGTYDFRFENIDASYIWFEYDVVVAQNGIVFYRVEP